jgi:hypothetical protein
MKPSLLTTVDAAADSTIPAHESVDVPRELLRQVAADLKSLAKALPYDEYATIVYRIARLRCRCGGAESSR